MKRKTIDCYSNNLYERTEQGLCYRMYYHQCRNSKHRGHEEPRYSKLELMSWVKSQPNFDSLYSSWVSSNFTSDLRPSCDRLDNTLGYSFGNMELVTWKENQLRANKDVANNKIKINQTRVWKYSLDGELLGSYESIAEACRIDKSLDQRNITSCCQAKISTAYGYFWSYTNLGPTIEPISSNTNYLCDIFQYDIYSGDIVNIYESILDIQEPEFNHMKIRNVIQGIYHTHRGFYWSLDYLSPDQINIDTSLNPKKINQLSMDNILISTYDSMSAASKATGIRSGNISKVCNNKAKSAGGFIWRLA